MQKWQKMAIALCVIVVVCSKYGYILYGSFGIDNDGYTADQNGKRTSYSIYGKLKQYEVDSCLRNLGINSNKELSNLNDLLTKGKFITVGQGISISQKPTATLDEKMAALRECATNKTNGYASPKKDAKNVFTSVKNWFSDDPESAWVTVGEISYNPNKPEWTPITVKLSDTTDSVCMIECVKGMRHQFEDLTAPSHIQCNGWPNHNASTELEDARFLPHAQLIKIEGITYRGKTTPSPCKEIITAAFIPNADITDSTNFNNTGKPVFIIKKLLKPTS